MAAQSEINVNGISLSSRDFMSIYQDLVDIIPTLSKLWTASEESDPGMVLVKLMSMIGDNLSFMQDRMSLEVFPESVTQRKNAAQIYALIGYKMHWYRSARCTLYLTNTNALAATVPKFTIFTTRDGSISYTNTQQIELPSNTTNTGEVYLIENLVQGIPRTPSTIGNDVIAGPNLAWHAIYDYNVNKEDIINRRLYLFDQAVDESTIQLFDNFEEEWVQVENVDVLSGTGKYFELRIDEKDQPYLYLVSYWDRFDCTQFKLFYIISSGMSGQISENALTSKETPIIAIEATSADTYVIRNISDDIVLENTASTYGYDPETPDEARINSPKYVNTFDTLVTLDDFDSAVRRLRGVAQCLSTDKTTDPNPDIADFEVRIYIVRQPEYEDDDKESYLTMIESELKAFKIMPLTLVPDLDTIKNYYWTVKGEVYLTNPVTTDVAQDLLVAINNQLRFQFGVEKLNMNTKVDFLDVINCIRKTDRQILHIDLKPLEFTTDVGDPVDVIDITGRTSYEYEVDPDLPVDHVKITLPHAPIKPNTVTIRVDFSRYVITDNGNEKLTSMDDALQEGGTINYQTGEIEFLLKNTTETNISIDYKKNVISMLRYSNFSTLDFYIASDSLQSQY